MRKQIYILQTISLLLLTSNAFSQETEKKTIPISLIQYLSNVSKENLGYIAEQFNVSIAEAEVKASNVFPDPEITFGYSNNQDQVLKMGQGLETGISYPISFGNRRSANMALARTQYELAELALSEYLSNLRADAMLSYFKVLKSQKRYLLQEETYTQLQKLARADSLRLTVGEANETETLQSEVEASAQLNLVDQCKAEMQNAFANLFRLEGKTMNDTLYEPSDDFPVKTRDFSLPVLIEEALKNKVELKIAVKNKEISEKSLGLLKANRAFEFNLQVGYAYSSTVRNEIAPTPSFSSYSAGVSIPLKFSNRNKDAVKAAKLTIRQNETTCRSVELQVITDIVQAYNTYDAQKKQLEHFNKGLTDKAGKILKSRIYSYQRGESGLTEVINARHTYNDIVNNHLETLYNYASALVELERVTGIWDLGEI